MPLLATLPLLLVGLLAPASVTLPDRTGPPPAAAPAAAPATSRSTTGTPAEAGTWPVEPAAVVRGFAPPDEAWHAGHRGVDLAASPGATVVSALPGTVSFVGRVGGKAVVVVSHGARRTTYEPVVPLVTQGTAVAAGQPLGLLVAPGSHCYPAACLHWGLKEGDAYLDPLRLVGPRRVRLLPW